MKKLGFLFAGLFVMALATQQVKAQDGISATGTADVKATLIRPITIEKVDDLNFGTIVVPSTTAGGTVKVDVGTTEVTGTDIILAESLGGPLTAASFTVSGDANATYTIALPEAVTITEPGGGEMTVTGFTSDLVSPATLPETGTQTLKVGATLTVKAGQAAGEYTGSFDVIVTYN
jgi:hypothetical protein